jgi:neopullulanase
MFTYPGAPCIYYGDEIGLDGKHDPDCRKTFPWDESRWNHDLHNYFKWCIALRKAHPALRRGSYTVLLSENNVYAFARQLNSEAVIVALNLSREKREALLPVEGKLDDGVVLRNVWGQDACTVAGGRLQGLKLSPRSGLVLTRV